MKVVLEPREYELAEFVAEQYDLEIIRLAIEMIKRKRSRVQNGDD